MILPIDSLLPIFFAPENLALASNYMLGAAAGDSDNFVLLDDGTLLRVDFSHLFGKRRMVDSPVPQPTSKAQ